MTYYRDYRVKSGQLMVELPKGNDWEWLCENCWVETVTVDLLTNAQLVTLGLEKNGSNIFTPPIT